VKYVYVALGCLLAWGCGTVWAIEAPAIGFEALTAFDRLPLLDNATAYQDSSYSRQHENADAGNYIRVEENGERVLMDTDGPGVIYRMWSTGPIGGGPHPHPGVDWRFYFDGETEPRMVFNSQELFGDQGAKWPFVPPLSRSIESGAFALEGPAAISYVPIPFARHLKITSKAAQFYQISYLKYPAGTPIESFTQELAEKNRAHLEKAARMLLDRGQMPNPPAGDMLAIEGPLEIAPGSSAVLYEGTGPAAVRALKVKLASASQANLRGLVLQIRYDGSRRASVNAPIGDFFGAAGGDLRYRSLPMGTTENGYYCYFPMPYRRSIRIEVRNDTSETARLSRSVSVQKLASVPSTAGYLHAAYSQDPNMPVDHKDFNILDVTGGKGKYVGCTILMQSAHMQGGVNYLEGDEAIYVDEEEVKDWPPRWVGTGTEDYFNGSYYWNAIPDEDRDQPYAGLTLRDDMLTRVCAYRWHITDTISFKKRIRVDLQHGPKSDWPCDYASVGFWYMEKPVAAPELPPVAERQVRNEVLLAPVVMGCELRGPFELREKDAEKGKELEVRMQPGLDRDPGNTIAIGVSPPYKQRFCSPTRMGQEIKGTLVVPGEDNYRITAFLAVGPSYGRFRIYVKTEGIQWPRLLGRVNAFSESYHPARAFPLGLHNLKGGEHELIIHVAGKDEHATGMDFGLVSLQCAPTMGVLVPKWQLSGPWPCPGEQGWNTAHPPETEQKLDAKYDVSFDGGKTTRPVGWRPFVPPPGSGVGLGGGGNVCMYGLSYVWSPEEQTVGAFISKDDALKMWVNGEKVFDMITWSHYISDQHPAACRLNKGWNTLLVKSGNWGGSWAFAVRLSDVNRELKFSNVPPPESAPTK